MNIFALTVGRNEVNRYLEPMLQHTRHLVDAHFYYDDQSNDRSAAVAADNGAIVGVRPDVIPRFTEDEGMFRAGAWSAFQQTMQPCEEDWVIVLDCDEFFLYDRGGIEFYGQRRVLETCLQDKSAIAVDLRVHEVFGFKAGTPQVRMDKLWGTIHAPRLFKWRPDGQYFQGRFGVPAVPSYVQHNQGQWDNDLPFGIMHYGYAHPKDVQSKYRRYSGQSGHSSDHVESIIDPDPTLLDFVIEMSPYMRELAWKR